MNTPYYGNTSRFKPSTNTLYKWLETRKSSNGSKPGVFQTVNYSNDAGWTLIAFLIELAAFSLTVVGALNHYSQYQDKMVLVFAIVAAILFVAFDVVGVALHGAERADKTLAKAKIALTNEHNELERLYRKVNKTTFREFSGIVMMLMSAFIKIGAILLLAGFVGFHAVLILCLFYLVVIYIHMSHTGYYLSARKCAKMLKDEEEKWWDDQEMGVGVELVEDRIVFQSPLSLPMGEEFRNGRQCVSVMDKNETPDGVLYNIVITTKGLMWDEDVASLLQNFPSNTILYPILLRSCVQLQMSQLNLITS